MDSHRTADTPAPESGTGGPRRATRDGEQVPRRDDDQVPRVVASTSPDLGHGHVWKGGHGRPRGVPWRDGPHDEIPASRDTLQERS